ncbi:helix-turn-helix transcriptional regulator [Actinoallomurus sp. NPDC052274]|uniref:helix-turn-helix domain-containing protein n=1 Tax=Actinoallomurus sp. NPDC052274 TaxID=3155420 RepID=UPI003432A215
MTTDGWASQLISVAASEIKRHRGRRGLSAQQVADACSEYGVSMKRSVIANLESGRRPTLSVIELVVLAKILRVAPIQLLLPIGHAEEVEILPGQVMSTWDAAKWFAGDQPLPHVDAEGNRLPIDPEDLAAWNSGAPPVPYFRRLDQLITAREVALSDAAAAHRSARAALSEEQRDIMKIRAESEERRVREIEREIQRGRKHLRQQGLVPPKLPPELAHLDEGER